jgi:RNA recognition motif-containing protein
MSKKLYVGNLPFSTNDDEIRDLFAAYGTVNSVALITDRETGRLRGFGFVEMDDEGAKAAIQALNGKDFGGRSLKVNEAEDKPRSGGGGGGGGRGGYGGGGGGRGGYGGGGGGGGGGYGGGGGRW